MRIGAEAVALARFDLRPAEGSSPATFERKSRCYTRYRHGSYKSTRLFISRAVLSSRPAELHPAAFTAPLRQSEIPVAKASQFVARHQDLLRRFPISCREAAPRGGSSQ